MIKTGVIGCGYAAETFHIPLIRATDGLSLTAISTSRPATVREKYPDVVLYADAVALLAQAAIDLVVITAPNADHFPLAKACLDHGKHVILEKPMVITAREGEALIQLAKRRGLTLSVFHNRRWDGDFLTVQNLLRDGRLGEIRAFESHFDRFRPEARDRWREQAGVGNGLWFDLGPHLLDQALCLFGEPEAITARLGVTRAGAKNTDYFHVQLHYLNREVVLHASCFAAGPNRRFSLQGTDGSYVKYGLDVQEDQLKAGLTPEAADFGREDPGDAGILYGPDREQKILTETGDYTAYYRGMVTALTQGGPPPVTAEEGLRVVRLLERAEESHHSGRRLSLT